MASCHKVCEEKKIKWKKVPANLVDLGHWILEDTLQVSSEQFVFRIPFLRMTFLYKELSFKLGSAFYWWSLSIATRGSGLRENEKSDALSVSCVALSPFSYLSNGFDIVVSKNNNNKYKQKRDLSRFVSICQFRLSVHTD